MRIAHLRQLTATLIVLALIPAVGMYLILWTNGARRDVAHGARRHVARGERLSPPRCTAITAGSMNGVAVHTPVNENEQAVAKATGSGFNLIEFYDAFGIKPFQWKEAAQAVNVKAVPVIQLNPRRVRLARIVAGKYDSYLRKYADAVRRFRCPVILSFGHEMNGSWYPWGCSHTSAADFIAAWRRIVTITHPARNIVWMWTVNTEAGSDCPLASRWPGGKYVDWIGVDGYLRQPGSTFRQVFQNTFTALHRLVSGKPFLISEAGALAGPGQGQRIMSIYQGAARNHVHGIIYFDGATRKFGDYRPQDNPRALIAFRKALRYFQGRQSAIGARRTRSYYRFRT